MRVNFLTFNAELKEINLEAADYSDNIA